MSAKSNRSTRSIRSAKSKFNEKSTAMQVIEGHNLDGREVIVTGGASGIGYETVRALAKAGARVVIATRNLNNANEAVADLKKDNPSCKVEAEKLDLSSLKSVHEFSKSFLAKNRPLHYLVNNAGVMACPKSQTEDGFEMQIGTNHFGHFALTLDLIPALKEGVKQSGKGARVVNVSSSAHAFSNIIFDDIHFNKNEYDPYKAYGQSKTANVLFSNALNKRFSKDGIYSTALMPGAIMTNLQRHMTFESKKQFGLVDENGKTVVDNPILKNVEQGAATSVWACVAAELEGRGGVYLDNCNISPIREAADILSDAQRGVCPYGVTAYAMDEQSAERFWKLTEQELSGK